MTVGGSVETKRPVEWLYLPDGEDWLLRPVAEGWCRYESLKDGSIDIEDLARMNQAIDVRLENERRYRKANE